MSIHTIRKVDVGMILSGLLIVGALYAGIGKPLAWDEAVKDLTDLKPRVEKDEKDIQTLKEVNATQMALIIRELDGIHRELRGK